MDEQLAQIYGTGQTTDASEDLQKQAAAELLVKLAEQEGIDLDKCTDEQITAMVQELYKTAEEAPPFVKKDDEKKEEKKETKGEESSGVESKNESKEAELAEKEAQAKFAEADFLGRVMAHAYVQELGKIEKTAKAAGEQEKMASKATELLKRFGKGVADKAGKAGATIKETAGKAGAAIKEQAKRPGVAAGAAGAAGVAAGAAGMHAIHKAKKKEGSAEPSALEALVQQRAFELAKEAGWVDAEGKLMAPPAAEEEKQEEKQASPLELAVDQQALQLLEANGYPVEWNKA